MKKLLLPALALLMAVACDREKLFKDVDIYLRTDALVNPLSLEIKDANPENAFPTGVSIEIAGPDADKIYTVTGKKAMSLDGPFLHLGIRRADAPTLEKPLYFIVIARAPGYLDASRLVSIADTGKWRIEPLDMIRLDAPPAGVAIERQNFTVSASGADQAVTIATIAAPGLAETSTVRIDQGTGFFGADNAKLTGSGAMTVVRFSPAAAANFYPGGPNTGTILESNGKQKRPGSLVGASAMVISAQVGGQAVTGFDAPITVTSELDPDFVSPATQSPLAANDSVPVWSYHEPSSLWREAPKTKAEAAASGKLTATFQTDHLSGFVVGGFAPQIFVGQGWPGINGGPINPPVGATGVWTVRSDIARACSNAGGGYFFTQLVTVNNGLPLYSGWENYFDGRSVRVSDWLASGPAAVKLRIWEGTGAAPGALLYEQVLPTGANADINVGSSLPKGLSVILEATGICGADAKLLPFAPVFYRLAAPSGASPAQTAWRLLGYVRAGEGCSGNLEKGKKYDFAAFFGGIQHVLPAITIPSEDKDIIVNEPMYNISNVLIQIRYEGADKNTIRFTDNSIEIPDDLCDEFRKYF